MKLEVLSSRSFDLAAIDLTIVLFARNLNDHVQTTVVEVCSVAGNEIVEPDPGGHHIERRAAKAAI